ncbi:MAG: agmatinase [Bacteroidia bacterium]|nr:MAG: agmatinase [Bacteroidia bacterium]
MVSFGDLPEEFSTFENARVAILPIPYDGTSTWVKGADRGPEALLEASANMELYDIESDTEPYTVGIWTAPPITEASSPEAMVEASQREAQRLIDAGKFVVTIGGEHSVSIGPIRAHAARYADLTVLQIDAHIDLRDEYEGSPYNHACVMARAQEVADIVQVGIRSMDADEKARLDPQRVFWAHRVVGQSGWEQEAIDCMRENVYITIDLDGFDPAICPSTGTPEPGGLQWYPTLSFLRRVFETRRVVGFDIVELCPNPHERSSDFLAAKLLYRLLAFQLKGQLQPLGPAR